MRSTSVAPMRRAAGCREAFACGTAAVVAPIGQMAAKSGNFTIGSGGPGQTTLRLREALVGIQRGTRPIRMAGSTDSTDSQGAQRRPFSPRIPQPKGLRPIGASPSGKAAAFDAAIRRFESCRPSQFCRNGLVSPVILRVRWGCIPSCNIGVKGQNR